MEPVEINHVGFWVSTEQFDGTLTFFADVLGFQVVTRQPRGPAGAGERAWIQAGAQLRFEVLTGPQTQPRPDVPVHPDGNVVGIPHLGFTVRDLPSWEVKLRAAGYPPTRRMPDDLSYMDYLGTRMRVLWFIGPAGVGFEMYEFGS